MFDNTAFAQYIHVYPAIIFFFVGSALFTTYLKQGINGVYKAAHDCFSGALAL